jgi:hypothetical protein
MARRITFIASFGITLSVVAATLALPSLRARTTVGAIGARPSSGSSMESMSPIVETQGQGSCADTFPGVKITHVIYKGKTGRVEKNDLFEVDWEFNPQQPCPQPGHFDVRVEVTRKDGLTFSNDTTVSGFARSAEVEVLHGISENKSTKATVKGAAQVSWKDQKVQPL